MEKASMNDYSRGVLYGICAYILWGILPLYWKVLDHVPSIEILAHRIVWSFVFVMVLIAFTGKWSHSIDEFKNLFKQWRTGVLVVTAAVLITVNWFTYIWAVTHDHVIETSLGYYINPLISVLIGMVFLKEKLNFGQIIAFSLAGVGVIVLTSQYGNFPWVAITLAFSFGFYGLCKKVVKLNALFSLTFETLFVTPIALIYITFLQVDGSSSFATISITTTLLLIGAGVATALPLLWFAEGARRIPLSLMGFLQYIAPTITLLLGIFLFHETFTFIDFIGFLFIWTALIIFTVTKTKWILNFQTKMKKNRSIGI